MFVGILHRTLAVGFVSRNHLRRQAWTHWRIEVVRERYDDSPLHQVDVYFSFARRFRGKWRYESNHQWMHSVELANVNVPGERDKLRSVEGQVRHWGNPLIHDQLQAAIRALEEYCDHRFKEGKHIDTHAINNIVRASCLKPAKPIKKRA